MADDFKGGLHRPHGADIGGVDWRARIYARHDDPRGGVNNRNRGARGSAPAGSPLPDPLARQAPLLVVGLGLILAVMVIPGLVAATRPSEAPLAEPAARDRPPAATLADAETPVDPALAALHPDVRAAVVAARRIRLEAERTERRALATAERAESAEAGDENLGALRYASGDAYWGEVVGEVRHGVGLYAWAGESPTTFAGQFRDDVMTGLGVKRWNDGAMFAGSRDGRTGAGSGVFLYTDGRRFEGQWRDGVPDGLGATWAADGTLVAQGVWADSRLVADLDGDLD